MSGSAPTLAACIPPPPRSLLSEGNKRLELEPSAAVQLTLISWLQYSGLGDRSSRRKKAPHLLSRGKPPRPPRGLESMASLLLTPAGTEHAQAFLLRVQGGGRFTRDGSIPRTLMD